MGWNSRVKVKHLLTKAEDHTSVQASMNAVADTLSMHPAFAGFNVQAFRRIPEGDDFFGPCDYANKLLERMYDYADDCKVWIA